MKRKEPANISDDRRRELIISTWRALGSASVGAEELAKIQQAIAEVFDEVVSPAGIARELAQAGAELRHPEIIESDARWRQAQIADRMNTLAVVSPLLRTEALNLKDAEAAITELENLRVRLTHADNGSGLNELRTLAIDARQAAVNRARDNSLPLSIQEVQMEIAEWLRVWLETPPLFTQWLELRKGTKSFRGKFAED